MSASLTSRALFTKYRYGHVAGTAAGAVHLWGGRERCERQGGSDPRSTLDAGADHEHVQPSDPARCGRGGRGLGRPADLTADPPAGGGGCPPCDGHRWQPKTALPSDHKSDHTEQTQEGSEWHSGASVRIADHSSHAGSEKAETLTKPGGSWASRGSSEKRLRSESNRRWRICNPLP